jgi:hypothetical protein
MLMASYMKLVKWRGWRANGVIWNWLSGFSGETQGANGEVYGTG